MRFLYYPYRAVSEGSKYRFSEKDAQKHEHQLMNSRLYGLPPLREVPPTAESTARSHLNAFQAVLRRHEAVSAFAFAED